MNYVCIDGNNFTLIAYAAAARHPIEMPLEDRIYGILSSMIRGLKKKFDGKFYVCWDTYGSTSSRKDLDSSYKATRNHSLFDFKIVESCKNLYNDYGIRSLSLPECEGDDALFVLCKLLKEQDPQSHIVVVSRDCDMLQIVQEGYANEIYDPCKKKAIEVPWYRITEYKALVGDPADNIPGVRGIGKKKALQVITGMIALDENQQEQYSKYLKMVDATLNPKYQENYRRMKELLGETQN